MHRPLATCISPCFWFNPTCFLSATSCMNPRHTVPIASTTDGKDRSVPNGFLSGASPLRSSPWEYKTLATSVPTICSAPIRARSMPATLMYSPIRREFRMRSCASSTSARVPRFLQPFALRVYPHVLRVWQTIIGSFTRRDDCVFCQSTPSRMYEQSRKAVDYEHSPTTYMIQKSLEGKCFEPRHVCFIHIATADTNYIALMK